LQGKLSFLGGCGKMPENSGAYMLFPPLPSDFQGSKANTCSEKSWFKTDRQGIGLNCSKDKKSTEK
jgi:hypothetical protein